MSLLEQITADLKDAMKERDQIKLNTVRLIKSALMNEQIKVEHELNADEELTVLNREKKQREESIAEYTKGGRTDLVEETKKELAIVTNYLPQQLSAAELAKLVATTITAVGAQGKSDFGKVMQALMPKIKGKADGKAAAKAVQDQLS
ncbi:GatB/YqeY domain-containing protein [Lactobacillus xylocopicola]|uniref:GatB/YqeY domain-containing protein n=1 Tax=Lactobacillus xylocopicola TaxID=2976676 RepID=UPI002953C718|nr:GatB/YqeY domain-containing protein [Lactobacillus xylocopicola]